MLNSPTHLRCTHTGIILSCSLNLPHTLTPHTLTHTHRKAVPSGMIAGAGGQFIASPTDRVKVLLQMEGRRVLDGHKPRYGQCCVCRHCVLKRLLER